MITLTVIQYYINILSYNIQIHSEGSISLLVETQTQDPDQTKISYSQYPVFSRFFLLA